MNWLAKFGLWLYRSTSSTASPTQWFIDWVNGGNEGSHSAAGVRVGPETALASSAVYACVQVRAQDIAKLPLILYRRRTDGGRERATDHPLYNLVGISPNQRQTSFEWREMMQGHCDLRGNSYARIYRDTRYRPIELIPLHPDWVTVLYATDGTPFYLVRMYGRGPQERLDATELLHIRDRSDDGFVGKSCITRARDLIGLNIAGQKHAAKMYANGARLSGIISLKGQVDSDGRKLAAQEFRDAYTGTENAGKVAVFADEGKFEPITMTQTDLQFVDQQRLTRQEIASIFRVPAHKIGIMDNATFSNIEHQSLEYVTDTLMPIARRWEMVLNKTLLRETEQGNYYFEFLFDALLRGDFLSRMQGYDIQRRMGRSYNDIAEHENWQKVPKEEGGDERLVPLNMWPMGKPRPDKTQGVGVVDVPADGNSAPPAKAIEHDNILRLTATER